MKQNIIQFLIATLAISCSSCIKGGGKCDEPIDIRQSQVAINFIDSASGNYIYSEINPLLNKDSLKVFDENGNSLVILNSRNQIPNTNLAYYVLSFGTINDQQIYTDVFNTEKCKDFIIYYQHNDLDTITACFKAKKTDCGSVFESLKVFYKGKLLATENNQTSALITILKN